jgi:Uma2 family endonuclease
MRHQEIAGRIYVKLFGYLEGKPCKVYADADVYFEEEGTVVAPDIFVTCDRSKIKRQHCLGAPDFIAEVLSPSTTKYDKTSKLALYKRQGVKEYWIVDPSDSTITTYNFESGKYWAEGYSEDDGMIPVRIFEGELELDLKFIFATD